MAQLAPLSHHDRLLGGKYRVGPVIGSGGVATVYRATHIWTEREVAVKILDPTLPHFDRLRQGFLREARATVQLHHPNVVDVLDMGEDDWETAYMVMELLEGPTLRDVLLEHGKLDLDETLSILLPLIDALEKAHELGIVHRDFKPENIMLSPDAFGVGIPKLLDFGVAEVLQDARVRGLRSGADIIMGTPQYMSPEQARDQRGLIGPHTDVWGVGTVWYECLTGRTLFDGDGAEEILRAVCEAEIDFDELPGDVASILRGALQREPENRIGSLSVLKGRLRAIGFTTASTPPPSDKLSTPPPPPRPDGATDYGTLAGLGPQGTVFPPTPKPYVRSEALQVPTTSSRTAAVAGLGLILAVALAAWWTVRDPSQSSDSDRVVRTRDVTPVPTRAEPLAAPAAPFDPVAKDPDQASERLDTRAAPPETAVEEPLPMADPPKQGPEPSTPKADRPEPSARSQSPRTSPERTVEERETAAPRSGTRPRRSASPASFRRRTPATSPSKSGSSYEKAPDLVREW